MEENYFGVKHVKTDNVDCIATIESIHGPVGSSNRFNDSGSARHSGSSKISSRQSSDGRHSPSPVPSSEARVRWAMLASLAGVKDKEHSSGSPYPAVRAHDDRGRTLPISQREQSRRLSRSQEPQRQKETPLSPPIPILSRPGSVHARNLSDSRFKAQPSQDDCEGSTSNPTSIEQYLKGLRNDPNIDDRGLRDGLKSLILGSGDENRATSHPERSVGILRPTTPESRPSSASKSNSFEGFINGVEKHTSERMPNPLSVADHIHRFDILPPEKFTQGHAQPIRNTSDTASSYQPAFMKASEPGNRAPHQKPAEYHVSAASQTAKAHEITKGEHLKLSTDNLAKPVERADRVHHNIMLDIAQGHSADIQQQRPPSVGSQTAANQGAIHQPCPRGDHRDPHSRQPPSAIPLLLPTDYPSSNLRPWTNFNQFLSTETSLPNSRPPILQDGTNDKTPVVSGVLTMQPSLTPPQTPGLVGRSQLEQHSSVQETPESEAPTKVHLPPSNVLQDRVTRAGRHARELSQTPVNDNFIQQMSLGPTSNNEHTQQQDLVSKPEAAANLGSPAVAIRAQIAQERLEKSQARQHHREQQPKLTQRKASKPPTSVPQAMLNMFKDKSQRNIEASNGNPGFVDRTS